MIFMIFMLISLGWRLLQILSPIHVFRVVRTLSVMLFSLLHPLKRKRNRRTDNGTPASPFSTNIRDAFIGNAYMVLSTIILPLQHCQAKVQKYFKQFRLTKQYATKRRQGRKFWFLVMLASFFITGVHANSGASDTGKIYELPGSNHAIIAGETSNDITRQYSYADTVINASKSVDVPHITTKTEPQVTSEDYPTVLSPTQTVSVSF